MQINNSFRLLFGNEEMAITVVPTAISVDDRKMLMWHTENILLISKLSRHAEYAVWIIEKAFTACLRLLEMAKNCFYRRMQMLNTYSIVLNPALKFNLFITICNSSLPDDWQNRKMTIVLDVSFSDQQSSSSDSQGSAINNEISRKKVKDKHNENSSKAIKVAKVKHKVNKFYVHRISCLSLKNLN